VTTATLGARRRCTNKGFDWLGPTFDKKLGGDRPPAACGGAGGGLRDRTKSTDGRTPSDERERELELVRPMRNSQGVARHASFFTDTDEDAQLSRRPRSRATSH